MLSIMFLGSQHILELENLSVNLDRLISCDIIIIIKIVRLPERLAVLINSCIELGLKWCRPIKCGEDHLKNKKNKIQA